MSSIILPYRLPLHSILVHERLPLLLALVVRRLHSIIGGDAADRVLLCTHPHLLVDAVNIVAL